MEAKLLNEYLFADLLMSKAYKIWAGCVERGELSPNSAVSQEHMREALQVLDVERRMSLQLLGETR